MAITQCIIIREQCINTLQTRLKAAKHLGNVAYKLYTYLEGFPQGEQTYDRLKFMKTVETTVPSANKAFDDMINKGYLVQKNEMTYYFFEEPKENIESFY